MRWTGLQNKIFILVISLFTLVLLLTMFSIYSAAKNQAQQQLQSSLIVGQNVTLDKMLLFQKHLNDSLSTLSKDWALRKAVGEQQDNESIVTILNNHGQRINSDLVWLYSPRLELLATTGTDLELGITPDQLKQLRKKVGIRIMTFDEKHYLMALEPVRAPRVIGWLLIGQEIDTNMLQQISQLTELQITLVVASDNSIAHQLAVSDFVNEFEQLRSTSQLPNADTINNELKTLPLGEHTIAMHPFEISNNDTFKYLFVLHKDADAVLTPLNDFIKEIIPFFLLGVFLAILGSLAIARGITKPVAELLKSARRIAGGDYSQQITVSDDGELGQLASEFGSMQHAVMERENKITQQAQELAKASQAKYEAAIAKQEREIAEAATQAKTQFLANMSHEIRTPLNSIIGYSEMLEDGALANEEKHSAANTINVCGKHLLSIVNNVLDVSKIEANKIELEWLSTPLVSFTQEIKTIVEQAAKSKGIEIKLAYHLPLPSHFTVDPTRLKQALVNLCNNAIKFTETGSVTLDLRFSPEQQQLSFTVVDTGIGMTPEQQDKLFGAFAQADQSTTRQHGGTGLGLFISKELTELMGGSISVSSEKDVGSQFVVCLPFKSGESTQLLETKEALESAAETAEKSQITIPQLNGSILCADDNADNLRLAEYLIGKTGADLTLVSDGEQAFESAMIEDFDLILMDMQMPVMSGVEATELLKGAGCPSAIVMLTANVDTQSREEIEASGADGYFSKPIDTQKFYQMLSQYLLSGENKQTVSIDDAELRQLKQEFLNGLNEYIAQTTAALQNENWQELKSICHQLKGNAGIYGFQVLADKAKDIESQLTEETVDLERIRLDIESLIHLLTDTFKA